MIGGEKSKLLSDDVPLASIQVIMLIFRVLIFWVTFGGKMGVATT